MKIKDIMSTGVKSVSTESTVNEAAKLMKEENIGFIPVVEGNILRGVITDRDIILRCVAEKSDYNKLTAKEIMSEKPVYISPEHSVTEAARLMAREQVRRLPVCEEGKVVGVLSLGDISRSKSYFSETAAAFCDISGNGKINK